VKTRKTLHVLYYSDLDSVLIRHKITPNIFNKYDTFLRNNKTNPKLKEMWSELVPIGRISKC
jgi:hypothetical protein